MTGIVRCHTTRSGYTLGRIVKQKRNRCVGAIIMSDAVFCLFFALRNLAMSLLSSPAVFFTDIIPLVCAYFAPSTQPIVMRSFFLSVFFHSVHRKLCPVCSYWMFPEALNLRIILHESLVVLLSFVDYARKIKCTAPFERTQPQGSIICVSTELGRALITVLSPSSRLFGCLSVTNSLKNESHKRRGSRKNILF